MICGQGGDGALAVATLLAFFFNFIPKLATLPICCCMIKRENLSTMRKDCSMKLVLMTTVAAVSAFAVPEWKVTVKMQPQSFALVEF